MKKSIKQKLNAKSVAKKRGSENIVARSVLKPTRPRDSDKQIVLSSGRTLFSPPTQTGAKTNTLPKFTDTTPPAKTPLLEKSPKIKKSPPQLPQGSNILEQKPSLPQEVLKPDPKEVDRVKNQIKEIIIENQQLLLEAVRRVLLQNGFPEYFVTKVLADAVIELNHMASQDKNP